MESVAGPGTRGAVVQVPVALQMAAWNRWREIEWDLKGPLSPGAVQKLTRRAHIKRGIINDITGRLRPPSAR